jgi:fucose permease
VSWVTRQVLVGLIVSVATMATSTFATVGMAALVPYLRSSLQLSTFEVGLIPSLVFIGALSVSIPAGRVTDRVGAGHALTLSQVGVATGIAIAVFASNRWVFIGGFAVGGLGYGTLNPATNVLSTALVPRRHRGLFLGVKQTGMPVGGLGAGLILPRLAQAFGWRSGLAVAVGVLLCGALVGRWIARREASGWFDLAADQAQRGPARPASVSEPGRRPTWVFGFAMAGVQLSFAGYITLYLVEARGFSATNAGVALSVAFAAACAGRIGWGWLSDRFFTSRATTLVLVSSTSVVALTAMAVGVDGLTLWVTIAMLGLCSIGWNGAYMALITDGATGGGLGCATGRGLTATYAGNVMLPPLLGAVKDLTDSWAIVWIVLIGVALLGTATLLVSPRRQVRVDVGETWPLEPVGGTRA